MDVIAFIIDNVDDRGTLFSLLTVSKDVFHHTCKVLYRDPMRFLRDRPVCIYYPEGTLQNRVSLLRLLVSLSPASDSDTNKLRDGLGLPQKREPITTMPAETMLDYLSFVQCLDWEGALEEVISPNVVSAFNDWYPPPGRTQSKESFVKSIIIWSLCGHRLDQITEIAIDPADIERYIVAASQLRRLRTIVIAAFNSASHSDDAVVSGIPDDTYSSTVRLVEALQQHHGKDLVHDCRFSPLMAPYVPEFMNEWNAQIRMKLPLLLPRDLKLAHPLRPMDSYLSRLVTLEMFRNRWCPRHKNDMFSVYSDMPIGQILQRCRSLVYLRFSLDRRELGGTGIFAWATHEAMEREAGRLLAPPVALEELKLVVDSRYDVSVPRILVDAMRGFALSLRSLCVHCEYFDRDYFGVYNEDDDEDDDENDDEEEMSLLSKLDDAPFVMRKLESLEFNCYDHKMLDIRLLHLCPRLTSLAVEVSDTTVLKADISPKWPVLHLPCLTQLALSGAATILFDQASFHGMPRLQMITLNDMPSHVMYTAGIPVLLDVWAWDWHLPELTFFQATMVSAKTKFSFRMLRCFPKLAELYLEFKTPWEKPPHQIELPSFPPNVVGDKFPALESLEMSGSFILLEEDLRFLMGPAFPSLREFSIEIPSSCTVEQVLALTRDHPSLENVKFSNWDYRPEEAMEKQLGLTLYDNGGGGVSMDGSCSYTFEDSYCESVTYLLK